MTDDEQLPREPYEHEVLQYQWYVGYDRDDEYDKDPQWTDDVESENEDVDSTHGMFGRQTVRFYNRFDPEHIWIRSDKAYDLVEVR